MYWYKPVHTRMYHHELHCNSFSYGIGFRSAIRDEPGLSERYVPAQESVLDEDLTAAELNHILQAHVVDGTLTTFGCVEWESEQFRGVMRARCYPFKMPKRRFHGVNPQVYMVVYPIIYSTYMYIPVHTSMYQYIPVHTATSTYFSNIGHTGMSWYVQVHGAHMYIPVCTCLYLSIAVHTSTSRYMYIPVHTGMY